VEVTHQRTVGPLPEPLRSDRRLHTLAGWGHRLAKLGISPEASGNLSCRSDDGFIITGTGVPLDQIGTEDWVEVIDVGPLSDGGLRIASRGPCEPSKDASVHAAIYGQPGAGAVFHLHPDYLDALSDDLGVPTTASYYPAGTTESVDEIERFLSSHHDAAYLVLVDHGIVSWGPAIDEAGTAVVRYHDAVAGS
jgi:ribulose-5-phosphate 4-epimerase/fuculose-1-phosphate aldolase